ncbi:MAG: uracil-DNA glycosylase [Candidatus Eiseniibacteriota bacterium]
MAPRPAPPTREARAALAALEARVVLCRACPRLVAHREEVARTKRAAYRDQSYWGRPVPAFGDPLGRLLIVGLAPAAHGGNRTGRMFTGDRSGDWLYDALHAAGFANQPTSRSRDDGLELEDAFVTAAARCAPPDNRPTPEEFARCRSYLVGEMRLLPNTRVVLALGALAWEHWLRAYEEIGGSVPKPRPKHAHGAEVRLSSITLLGSYHPSQQNTQTGRLTRPMLHSVFERARAIVDGEAGAAAAAARDPAPGARAASTSRRTRSASTG